MPRARPSPAPPEPGGRECHVPGAWGFVRGAAPPPPPAPSHGRLAERRDPRRGHRGLPRPAGKGGGEAGGRPGGRWAAGGPWARRPLPPRVRARAARRPRRAASRSPLGGEAPGRQRRRPGLPAPLGRASAAARGSGGIRGGVRAAGCRSRRSGEASCRAALRAPRQQGSAPRCRRGPCPVPARGGSPGGLRAALAPAGEIRAARTAPSGCAACASVCKEAGRKGAREATPLFGQPSRAASPLGNAASPPARPRSTGSPRGAALRVPGSGNASGFLSVVAS